MRLEEVIVNQEAVENRHRSIYRLETANDLCAVFDGALESLYDVVVVGFGKRAALNC